MDINTYPTSCCEVSLKGLSQHNPSIRERLNYQKDDLEARLQRVNEAIAALDAAPETARVLELISKV